MGLVQSLVPLARPMKFSTPIGATFGNSVQCRSPAVVRIMAVVSGAEGASWWMGGVAADGAEPACAAANSDVKTIRTSVCSRVRMDAPVSIFVMFNCTTVNPPLLVKKWLVEGRAYPPDRDAAAGVRGRGETSAAGLLIDWLASRGSPVRLRGRRAAGCRPESCGYRQRCSRGRAALA